MMWLLRSWTHGNNDYLQANDIQIHSTDSKLIYSTQPTLSSLVVAGEAELLVLEDIASH